MNYIASLNTPVAMLIFGTYIANTNFKSIFKNCKGSEILLYLHANKSAAKVSGELAEDTRFLGQRQRSLLFAAQRAV